MTIPMFYYLFVKFRIVQPFSQNCNFQNNYFNWMNESKYKWINEWLKGFWHSDNHFDSIRFDFFDMVSWKRLEVERIIPTTSHIKSRDKVVDLKIILLETFPLLLVSIEWTQMKIFNLFDKVYGDVILETKQLPVTDDKGVLLYEFTSLN